MFKMIHPILMRSNLEGWIFCIAHADTQEAGESFIEDFAYNFAFDAYDAVELNRIEDRFIIGEKIYATHAPRIGESWNQDEEQREL